LNQADIIYQLKQGDAAVFKTVVDTWQNKVYNTSVSIVQNEADAEDITQEVFITLFERIADFREEAQLSSWIYRITITKSLDHEKRKKRIKRGGLIRQLFFIKQEDEPVNFVHPGVLLDNKERSVVLFKALKKLPEKQRVAFTLHKMEGLSYQEIATVMEISLYAVESLQTRAKNNLKEILMKYYQQNSGT
jgi:RNA polymerase sigma factor (sigma-70 family)